MSTGAIVVDAMVKYNYRHRMFARRRAEDVRGSPMRNVVIWALLEEVRLKLEDPMYDMVLTNSVRAFIGKSTFIPYI